MSGTMLKTVMAAAFFGLMSLFVAGVALAADPPKIMPADPNSVPAHEEIKKAFSLFLFIVVLVLMFAIIMSVLKMIGSLRDGEGVAGGAAASFVVSLVFLALIVTQGTGFLTSWAAYF